MASNDGKPTGFLKFIIVSSLGLSGIKALLTHTSLFHGSSMVPYAFGLWVLYRIARVQTWWPFSNESGESEVRSGKSQLEQVRVPEIFRELAKPLKPGYQKARSAQVKKSKQSNALKTAGRTITEKYSPKTVAAEAADQMTAKELALSKLSNVGTRVKTIRHKTDRSKCARSKKIRAKRHVFAAPQ